MGFEVAPTPLRRRGLLPGAIVLVAVLAVIGVALATSTDRPPAPSGSPGPLAVRASGGPPTPAARTGEATDRTESGAVVPRLPPPEAIVCHGIDAISCGEVARAAIALLSPDDGVVTAIAAWPTILCNDDLDCPRGRLVGYRPLGSAVVSVASGAQAWVNVLEPAPYPGRVWDPTSTEAWVLRWLP